MHRLFLAWLLAISPTLAQADSAAPPTTAAAHVVKKFDGVEVNASTSVFTVQDKWELFWFSPRAVDITIVGVDGTVVAGVHGTFKGSLYMPKGGAYYLQINSPHPEMQIPWELVVAEVGTGTSLAGTEVNGPLANPGDPNYALPTILPPSTAPAPSSAPYNSPNSFVNGVSPAPASSYTSGSVTVAPPAPVPPVTTGKLTEDQARAVVLIKGDNAEGTGFLVKTPDGPAVITNIHVIANNPNLKITTSTGALVPVVSSKAASDRDLAMLMVAAGTYSYLEMAADISTVVQPGDEVITPGNSEGGEVMLNTGGHVLGIGPERVEIDNPIYHGNSGGPVFHVKSGKVLGVVTEAMKVNLSDELDKVSFASRSSAIASSMRYFALRLDTVSAWVPIEDRRFRIETQFLDDFEEQSKRLDSFLNSTSSSNSNSSSSSTGGDNSKLYLQDARIMKANTSYSDQASGGDTAQRINALRGLLFDLQGIVDLDMDQIQNDQNFYPFDRERAHDERDYRAALKTELNSIGDDIERLGHLPRTNDNN